MRGGSRRRRRRSEGSNDKNVLNFVYGFSNVFHTFSRNPLPVVRIVHKSLTIIMTAFFSLLARHLMASIIFSSHITCIPPSRCVCESTCAFQQFIQTPHNRLSPLPCVASMVALTYVNNQKNYKCFLSEIWTLQTVNSSSSLFGIRLSSSASHACYTYWNVIIKPSYTARDTRHRQLFPCNPHFKYM